MLQNVKLIRIYLQWFSLFRLQEVSDLPGHGGLGVRVHVQVVRARHSEVRQHAL